MNLMKKVLKGIAIGGGMFYIGYEAYLLGVYDQKHGLVTDSIERNVKTIERNVKTIERIFGTKEAEI